MFTSTYSLAENKNIEEQKKIDFLLDEIGQSQVTFMRNGSEHTPTEAKGHLKSKLSNAKKMFWFFGPERDISAKEFIEKIASQSSTSGKDYHIKLPNGKIIPTRNWLKDLLKNYGQKRNFSQAKH
jgi:hypothetical protein